MNPIALRDGFPGKRINAVLLCCAFLIGIPTMRSLGAEKPGITTAEVDRSVIAALSQQGVGQPKIISHIDLAKPFQTLAPWTLVVAEDEGQPPSQIAVLEGHGPIFVCLVKAIAPDCTQRFYRHVGDEHKSFDTPFHLLASSVVYASRDASRPLLLVKVCGAESTNGNCGIATALYRYDRRTDAFSGVFLNVTGRNNNEATRFVEHGPLQGDVIVDYPTEHAPYTYWIEVYGPRKSGRYVRILRYRGHTGYGDGNPLAVADSEMPEILRLLGLWKPGDPLPLPAHLPQGCNHLFIRNGEEWCK